MANFDLISEDDFFSGTKKEESKNEKPEKSQPDEDLFAKPLPETEENIFGDEEFSADLEQNLQDTPKEETMPQDFNEDLNENFNFDQPEPEENIDIKLPDEPFDEEPIVPTPEPEPEPEPDIVPPPTEPDPEPEMVSDYYDEKQEGVNYKPIIYGFLIIIVLAALGYFGWKYFLSSPGDIAATNEQSAESELNQQQGPSPEEIRINNFYSDLSANTSKAASQISGISGVALKQAKLSSVLFYGNDFTFEVFGKSRDALAKLNIDLKNTFKNENIKVISSQDRPGSSGGVLGIYQMKIPTSGGTGDGTSTVKPLKSEAEINNWLSFLVDNGSLKQKNVKTKSVGQKDGFSVVEYAADFSGTRDNLLQFISNIGSANKNIKISKLSLGAVDQKTFNSKKYQLRLIMQVYM